MKLAWLQLEFAFAVGCIRLCRGVLGGRVIIVIIVRKSCFLSFMCVCVCVCVCFLKDAHCVVARPPFRRGPGLGFGLPFFSSSSPHPRLD